MQCNPLNFILWFLILIIISFFVAGFCAGWYILIYCLSACIGYRGYSFERSAISTLLRKANAELKTTMNIEIKAAIGSVENFEKKVRELSKSDVIVIKQRDIFFIVPNGRLKLRLFENGSGELIYYERPDTDGPKVSSYKKTSLDAEAAQGIKEVLSVANGVLGDVIKTRRLYMIGQTRVHVDRVDGLGDFMELEVILRDNQNVSEGEEIANDLMTKLDVKKENLISGAYLDLLKRKKS